MKNFVSDFRDGGPSSNRATDSQLQRLHELKIHYTKPITWMDAKKLIREYHQNKAKKK